MEYILHTEISEFLYCVHVERGNYLGPCVEYDGDI